MDPGTKVGIFFGVGLLVFGGGWGLFQWLTAPREDPTAYSGEEAEDPAEEEGPPRGTDAN
jgi:hypothetical protein